MSEDILDQNGAFGQILVWRLSGEVHLGPFGSANFTGEQRLQVSIISQALNHRAPAKSQPDHL